MEITEPAVAKMIANGGVQLADIESNNGGRGFGRNVARILKENNYNTRINALWQTKNKEARILTNATWIMDNMYFPANWADRWVDFYDSMATYQRKGKNKHDDAQDALTGVAEKLNRPKRFGF
jgi:predicted phage terminase large subunit-like protein